MQSLVRVPLDLPHGLSSIVPDGVVRSEADPLRNRAVLLLRLGELLLRAEGLVALLSRAKKMRLLALHFNQTAASRRHPPEFDDC